MLSVRGENRKRGRQKSSRPALPILNEWLGDDTWTTRICYRSLGSIFAPRPVTFLLSLAIRAPILPIIPNSLDIRHNLLGRIIRMYVGSLFLHFAWHSARPKAFGGFDS